MDLSINFLSDLTGAENLVPFTRGESIPKFIGIFENQKIILRCYPFDSIQNDKFEREGSALRSLNSNTSLFEIPEIIGEWNGNIRAISYLEGREKVKLTSKIIEEYSQLLLSIDFGEQYHFLKGIFSNLNEINDIDKKYRDRFVNLRDDILDPYSVDMMSERPLHLIHGDFHAKNLVQMRHKIGIIDWEYASLGTYEYDLAYYYAMSDFLPSKELKSKIVIWAPLVKLILTHWYLLYFPNDPINEKRIMDLENSDLDFRYI